MKPCIYYPVPDDDEHGGVCYAGSELGTKPCTEDDEYSCQYAN
jgi:hypothetical protein